MVAEVNLYWIIYTHCSKVPVDLPKTQDALHEWKQQWKFLFGMKFFFHFSSYPADNLEINHDLNSFRWVSTLLNF